MHHDDHDDRPDWEQALDHDPELHDDYPVRSSRCVECDKLLEHDVDSPLAPHPSDETRCYGCVVSKWLCAVCNYRYARADGWCRSCRDARLCAICRQKPRRSGHRCDTCRKYFERNGRERPARLAGRQSELNARRALKAGEIGPTRTWGRDTSNLNDLYS